MCQISVMFSTCMSSMWNPSDNSSNENAVNTEALFMECQIDPGKIIFYKSHICRRYIYSYLQLQGKVVLFDCPAWQIHISTMTFCLGNPWMITQISHLLLIPTPCLFSSLSFRTSIYPPVIPVSCTCSAFTHFLQSRYPTILVSLFLLSHGLTSCRHASVV